jgi:hypothetical protein
MKARILFVVLLLVAIALWQLPGVSLGAQKKQKAGAAPAQAPSACQFPSQSAATPEQTAWEIFVAAACATGTGSYPYLTWESWPNQNDIYPNVTATPAHGAKAIEKRRRFTPSLLGAALLKGHGRTPAPLPAVSETGCQVAGEYQGPPAGPPSGRTICEEVHMNTTLAGTGAADFVTHTRINNRPQQETVAQAGKLLFPPTAIEVKANWIQYPLNKGACPTTVSNVWTEIDGDYCYALAAIHVISKLIPNWIWATFEAQNRTTNPNRCVYLGCYDGFGSVPLQTPVGGGSTTISPALLNLMQSAKLDQRFQNYRLDGIQTNFSGNPGNSTLLGSSVIEAETAQQPLNHSSCITCHNESSIGPPPSCTDGIKSIKSLTGPPPPLAQGFPRDSVWSLLLAYPPSCSGAGAASKRSAPVEPGAQPGTAKEKPPKT